MAEITPARYALSDDRLTLVIKRRTPAGIQTATLHRDPHAGPFTDADVAAALNRVPEAAGQMQPGQRNMIRRDVTRFGTVWTHVMTGPPTWWRPRLERKKDGTLMAGWLRFAAAVKFERGHR